MQPALCNRSRALHCVINVTAVRRRKTQIMLEHFKREYNINQIFLSHIGLWPFQSKRAKTLLPTFCLLLEISFYRFEILTLYVYLDNMQVVFETCYQIAVSNAFIVRMLCQLWSRDKLQRLYEAIDYHWNIFTSDTEVRVLKYYSSISRKFTIFYSTLMYLMMSGFIIIPSLVPTFLNIVLPLNEPRSRSFAIKVEFNVDQEQYFVPIFIYITAVIVVGMSIMVGVDTTHIMCTAHACSLFSIVGQEIENVITEMDNSEEIDKYKHGVNGKLESSREEMIYRKYIMCLKKHQLAIEFVDILNSSYQMLALYSLLFIMAVLSLIGIRIVYVLDQMQEMARFMFIIMGALMQLMIVCYSSQRLIDESQNIFHRAYTAKWYDFSPRTKSLLIITFYRSIVPCGLSAGNMFQLSMTTYATVVRMSMSYFTAFLSFKE